MHSGEQIVINGRQYRLDTVLSTGAGSYGQVWAATDAAGRAVALKFINIEAMSQADPSLHGHWRAHLEREILFLDGLNAAGARHIVALIDHGQLEDQPVLVLERLQANLAQWLFQQRREGALPPDLARLLSWTEQILNGLDVIHHAGFVYRDLKFSNILVAENGELLKLADFGSLKREDGDSTRSCIGTPATMAPEQILPIRHGESGFEYAVDFRADYYALGLLLFTLLTEQATTSAQKRLGQLLALYGQEGAGHYRHELGGLTTEEQALLRRSIEFWTVPIRPEQSTSQGTAPLLTDLVIRLLARDPADRPTSSAEIRTILSAVLAPPLEAPFSWPADLAIPPELPPHRQARRAQATASPWLQRTVGLVSIASLAGVLAWATVISPVFKPTPPESSPQTAVKMQTPVPAIPPSPTTPVAESTPAPIAETASTTQPPVAETPDQPPVAEDTVTANQATPVTPSAEPADSAAQPPVAEASDQPPVAEEDTTAVDDAVAPAVPPTEPTGLAETAAPVPSVEDADTETAASSATEPAADPAASTADAVVESPVSVETEPSVAETPVAPVTTPRGRKSALSPPPAKPKATVRATKSSPAPVTATGKPARAPTVVERAPSPNILQKPAADRTKPKAVTPSVGVAEKRPKPAPTIAKPVAKPTEPLAPAAKPAKSAEPLVRTPAPRPRPAAAPETAHALPAPSRNTTPPPAARSRPSSAKAKTASTARSNRRPPPDLPPIKLLSQPSAKPSTTPVQPPPLELIGRSSGEGARTSQRPPPPIELVSRTNRPPSAPPARSTPPPPPPSVAAITPLRNAAPPSPQPAPRRSSTRPGDPISTLQKDAQRTANDIRRGAEKLGDWANRTSSSMGTEIQRGLNNANRTINGWMGQCTAANGCRPAPRVERRDRWSGSSQRRPPP